MNPFASLIRPVEWLPEFGAQAALSVAIVLIGALIGLLLGRLLPVRQGPRVARWITRATPVLALVLVPAVLLGDVSVWLIGLVGACWVAPSVWAATGRPLTAEQALIAEVVGMSRADHHRELRGGWPSRVVRTLTPAWRTALTITTAYGLLATGAEHPAATGLGGLIATAVRDNNYPPALAGAIGLVLLGALGEIAGAAAVRGMKRNRGAR